MQIRDRIFAIREEFEQLRYERPKLARIISLIKWITITWLLLLALWLLAPTPVGQLLGIDSLQKRAVYGYQALSWARKGIPNAESLPIVPARHAATIERASKGKLLITYYHGGQSSRRIIKLSNIVIHDTQGFDNWAQPYLLKPVTVDFYLPTEKYSEHDVWEAVVWVSKKPINIELVEQDIGTPEINPLTTAVNLIYSQWYLQKAVGN